MRTDLTENEQKNVRTALRFLWRKLGAWQALAAVLHYAGDTLEKVVNERRPVTATLALHLAFFLKIPVEDLLAGKYTPAGTCPYCGHAPDFGDDATVVNSEQ